MMMFFGAISSRKLGRQLLPSPAVAQGDRDGPFGGVLPDDVLVELAHDLLGVSPSAMRAGGSKWRCLLEE